MKIVKSDCCSTLREDNTKALLYIKVEDPEIEEFFKEHSSDAAVFWWDAEEQRKGGNGIWKKINVLERLNSLGLQTNSLVSFLKAAVMKMNAVLSSALVTVRQN